MEPRAIRPGAAMRAGKVSGTFNFVFRNRATGQLGIGAAAHVVKRPHQRVSARWESKWHEIGEVVVFPDAYVAKSGPEWDFALVGVYPQHAGRVDASLGADGPPRDSMQARKGDVVTMTGHGLGVGSLGTRKGKVVEVSPVLTHWALEDASRPGLPVSGDSGGPVVVARGHLATAIVTELVPVNAQTPGVLQGRGTSWPRIASILGPDWELVRA